MTATRPGCGPRGLAGLAFAQGRRFQRGEFVIRADWPAEVVYLIRRGQVRCFRLDRQGRETTTAVLGRGQLVGIAPFLGRDVHHEFAQALNALEAWALPADELGRSLPTTPALQGLVLGCLAQRLDLALALLRDVSLLRVPERVCDMQTRLAACLGTEQVRIRRATLAGLLQIRPETLSRAQPRPRTRFEHEPVHLHLHAGADPHPPRAPIGPGTRVFGPGDLVVDGTLPRGWVGLLLAGQLELSLVGAAGAGSRSVLVDTLETGDLVGLGNVLGMPPIGLRLVGAAPGALEVLHARQLLDRLVHQPATCSALIMRFAQRLDRVDQQLARAAIPDVRERLLQALRELAAREGSTDGAHRVPVRWSHQALARQLGTCRETVTRGLAALARGGLIGRDGRRILVLGPAESRRPCLPPPPRQPLGRVPAAVL